MFENTRKELIRKFQKVKSEQYFYQYLFCIAISLLLGLILKTNLLDSFVFFNIKASTLDHALTFSTCATILATVFSIIFVLLTVFIQVSDVFVSADIFTEKKTLSLMMLYFFTITLSLMMLETNIKYPILVLTLTFACIILLYPFLLNINSKLIYEVGVVKLNSEIPSLIESGNVSLVNRDIMALARICKRSIKEDRYEEFIGTMSIFETSFQIAKSKKMIEVIRTIGYQYLKILDYIVSIKLTKENRKTMISVLYREIQNLLTNNFDIVTYDIMDYQTHELKDICIKMIKSDFDNLYTNKIIRLYVKIIYHNMQNIDRLTCDKKLISDFDFKLEPDIIEYVGELANESYNHKKECSSLDIFITALFAIGAKSSELSDKSRLISPFTTSEVIEQLNAISKNIGKNSNCIENLLNKLTFSIKNDELFHGSDFFTDSEHKTTYLELFKKNYEILRTK